MKKKFYVAVCLISAILISGCGYIKITEGEKDRLAEYMAGKLLEYDRYYDDGLVKEPEVTPEPEESKEPEVTPEPEPEESKEPEESSAPDSENPEASEEPGVSSDLNGVFNNKGINISYKGYKECSSYPEDLKEQYFVVEAGFGKNLWVLDFKLENTTDSDIKINQLDSPLGYRVILEDGSTVSPLKSWLTDDLQFIERSVPAGKSITAQLVFEVEAKTKADNAKISFYEGENMAEVPLK